MGRRLIGGFVELVSLALQGLEICRRLTDTNGRAGRIVLKDNERGLLL